MSFRASILLVDDEPNILKTVKIGIEAAGFEVTGFANPLEALDALKDRNFDIAFFDLKMEPMDGIRLLEESRKHSPETTVVIMTAHGTIDSAVEAIKKGAFDYLQKPFEYSELKHFVERVYEHHLLRKEVRVLREELALHRGTGDIITRSPAMRPVVDLAKQVAAGNITVLIEGESGTGKDLLARLIHEQSQRVQRPFVQVNCAALPEALLESELFGHVKGAFTGAVKDRQGRFEAADTGTIFLDEVTELPTPTQAKLLRFLQSREFERVGESSTRKVDVRVIAATNKNLEEAVNGGTFREDLFYRLNSIRLKLPPLRERADDIPLLVQHFLQKFDSRNEISPQAMNALKAYPWKGNIRELEHVIERAVLLARHEIIQLHHLPEEFQSFGGASEKSLSLEDIEKQHIIRVLRTAADFEAAASVLGIDPATLWRKRKKYGL